MISRTKTKKLQKSDRPDVNFRNGPRSEFHSRMRELAEKAHKGDKKATEELLNECRPFVKSIARTWPKGRVSSLDDMYSEGNLGVLHAIRKWDGSKNEGTFLTYAGCWIRAYIQRFVALDSCAVHIPVNKVIAVQSINNRRFANKSIGRTDEQDPDIRRMNTSCVQEAEKTISSVFMSMNQITKIHNADTKMRFEEVIADRDSNTESDVSKEELSLRVQVAIACMDLNDREKFLLQHRILGDNKDQDFTLWKIGEKLNISRERVRQVEIGLKKKLKPALAKIYEDYTEDMKVA